MDGFQFVLLILRAVGKVSLWALGTTAGVLKAIVTGTVDTTAAGIETLWEKSIPLLQNPPPVRAYAPGSWGPNAIHQLIAPHAWRLPFERSWRDPNATGF